MTKAEYIQHIVDHVSSDSLESYVRWMEEMDTRFALADNHREVAEQIRNRFIAFGYLSASLDSFYLTRTYREIEYSSWQYNIIASLPGREDDSICIVGAHYDNIVSEGDPFTLSPGANDNASGVAAVLEIARIIKERRFRPKHTVSFIAFAAEELGLHGSLYQAGQDASAGNRIKMMINYDMIAYLEEPSTTPWLVNIIHYDNSEGLKNEAAALCAVNSTLVSYSDNTNYNRSDSYAYYMNGFRALFFHQSDIESTYHSVGDVTSVCNFQYCREIVRASFALVLDKNY
ncbi:MAG: M28 family metallopeptidase [Bacteroidales bacterium]|nr:M28 family metallopeptidase [Bacteroidales bacterium]MDT8374432.1 M28 family metallopeptidase [Bacteroidales bacterium]